MSMFSNESLSARDAGNRFSEPSFAMTDENLRWAEEISLFSNDMGMLRQDFRKKLETAPNAEAASFVFEVVFKRLKKKVMQLNALIDAGIEISNDHLLKLQEVADFEPQKAELLSLISDSNRAHPAIKKVFKIA